MKNNIAIVSPVYNEESNIRIFISEIEKIKKVSHDSFDLIIIDDGSTDNTFQVLNQISTDKKFIKVIKFSRNYGKEIALSAGLNYSEKYDAVVTLDFDLQHPPKLILSLVKEWKNGHSIVAYVRKKNEGSSLFREFFSILFHKFINFFVNFKNIRFNTDFRILDKKVVIAFNQNHTTDALFRVRLDSLGFDCKLLEFIAPNRILGKSNYSVYKLFRSALYSVFDLSVRPLKMVFLFSSIFFFLTLILLTLALIDYFFIKNFGITKQTLIIIFNLFITSINFVFLGLISIYLSSIKNLISKKQNYRVERRLNIEQNR